MDVLLLIAAIVYLMFVIYAANQVQIGLWEPGILRMSLISLATLLFLIAPCSMQALILSSQPELAGMIAPISLPQAALVATVAAVAALFSFQLIQRPELRAFVARYVKSFNPDSPVHLTAVVLCLLALTSVAFQFVLTGGLSGVAESLETTGISVTASILETALWIAAAFLGVGFAIRRGWPASLERLGLRPPTREDWLAGAGWGIGLFLASNIFAYVWQAVSDPQTFAEQTRAAQEIGNQIMALPVAILVAGGAAFGEEVFMRGALQPVFGLWLTTAFFTLLHTQYLVTPTLVLVFVVGLSFGRLRQTHSTTAAIIAHFIYNVVPFVLLAFAGGAAS